MAVMSDARLRIRANRSTGELEVEGSSQTVAEWWQKLWPTLGENGSAGSTLGSAHRQHPQAAAPSNNVEGSGVFGEFYTEFRSDISDIDKMLIASAFVQSKDPERVFTTKGANQLLMDQNVKVANASECVRRLTNAKRTFVVSDGRFRVSASGFEHLKSLKTT
jgi:hypothetical protein